MTFRPDQIGDKGQRFVIKYGETEDGTDEHILGYAPTHEGAEQMASAWRKHPAGYHVWIMDREAKYDSGQTRRGR